jgi:hypothetical protein
MKLMKTNTFQLNSLHTVFITFVSIGLYSQIENIKTKRRFKFAKVVLKYIYTDQLLLHIYYDDLGVWR